MSNIAVNVLAASLKPGASHTDTKGYLVHLHEMLRGKASEFDGLGMRLSLLATLHYFGHDSHVSKFLKGILPLFCENNFSLCLRLR